MKNDDLLSISEFSKISEVSRKALIFYEKIGLITVINTMSELGVPLKQIKESIQMVSLEQAVPFYCSPPIFCSKNHVPDLIMVDFYNECEKREGYRIIGNAYEEYLLDEMTTPNAEDFLFQISIQVEQ